MTAIFYNRKTGKEIERSNFITESDARLKALSLNWNCDFIDHHGNKKAIV